MTDGTTTLRGNIAHTEKTILVPLETELQDPVTFNYVTVEWWNPNGGAQTWTVPDGVTSVSVDAYGASDYHATLSGNSNPGKGGRVQTNLTVTPLQKLNIYVGGYIFTHVLM